MLIAIKINDIFSFSYFSEFNNKKKIIYKILIK